MDSKNPQSSIAVTMLDGKVELLDSVIPEALRILEITPCTISTSLIISSKPCVITIFAIANLINNFKVE